MKNFIIDTLDGIHEFCIIWGPEFPAMYSFIFFLNY